ncbi:hypothetical protein TSUD_161620 [Trifolium subterraneum]|uniref:Uncharacterized protein n=1 Tax=Trifolium subterraneum TaxID=3900 RepID=A0A2Z6NJ47_TRISU|nr:hypothetical protein TSUD_161620 [Trifolium subterraneum]
MMNLSLVRSRFSQILSEFRERLKIAPKNGINKNTSIISGVSRRNINDVRFNNNRTGAVVTIGVRDRTRMKSCNRTVVSKPVIATDHAETDDVAFIVENFETFGADGGGEAGNDANFTESAYVTVAEDEVAAFDKVFIGLWIVEATDDGPDGGDRSGDFLDYGGATLV